MVRNRNAHKKVRATLKGASRLTPLGPRLFVAASLLSVCHAADTNSAPEQIPELEPPRGLIPPGFWEQYGLWVVIGSGLILAVAAGCLWILTRPKPPVLPRPETAAREALGALRGRPEDGALLSQVSKILRQYLVVAFGLPGEELTTAEFCRVISGEPRLGPELAAALGEFLRQGDERKFSPQSSPASLGAVERALQLIELAQTRRGPAYASRAGGGA